MIENSELLIKVLSDFIWEKQVSQELFDALLENISELLHLAGIHDIQGIVAYKILEYAKANPNDELNEIAAVTEPFYLNERHHSLERESCYKELMKHFDEEEIEYIPFKGIIVKDFYIVPPLRTFGDIDIIIHKKDRNKSHDLMIKLGYKPKVNFGEVYSYTKGVEYYEIHTDIMLVDITNRADYKSYFKNMWKYAHKINAYEYRFSLEFHFVYLISHIAKHIYTSGAGIRMYLDIAFIIKSDGKRMDWNFILSEIEKLKLKKFLNLTLKSINKWFNIDIPYEPIGINDSLMNSFFEFTFSAGTYGYEGRCLGEENIRKVQMFDRGNSKIGAIKSVFFPDADKIKNRYVYLKKYPFLLPFAWIDRLIRNRGQIIFKLKESKDILDADNRDIEEKVKFYHEIGL